MRKENVIDCKKITKSNEREEYIFETFQRADVWWESARNEYGMGSGASN
ncbi:hypothetical protein BCE_3378 [Bacillus cereus ATCC 10987]|uniref:Uncharacterized protein n=1 Tax=Bacillus cereus (strain ATCC 10987 / NRS 248) TaxID=222523 RepID=Q734M6_BACC1|nr:hypothetical protein BCE_3378 [Bacillus cereus ATCC 10987]